MRGVGDCLGEERGFAGLVTGGGAMGLYLGKGPAVEGGRRTGGQWWHGKERSQGAELGGDEKSREYGAG